MAGKAPQNQGHCQNISPGSFWVKREQICLQELHPVVHAAYMHATLLGDPLAREVIKCL